MIASFESIRCVKKTSFINTVYDFAKSVETISENFPDGIWHSNHFFHLFKAPDGIRMQIGHFIRSKLYSPIVKLNKKKTFSLVPDESNNSYLILAVSFFNNFFKF